MRKRMENYARSLAAPSFAAQVRQAEIAIRDLFEPTPLQRNDHLSAKFGAEIWLKREDLTPVRSYKLRGAFNAMRRAGAGPRGETSASDAPRSRSEELLRVRRRRGGKMDWGVS